MKNIKSELSLFWAIFRALNIKVKHAVLVLFPYYIVAILNSSLEALGMILLVGAFTGGINSQTDSPLVGKFNALFDSMGVKTTIPEILPYLIGLFLINFFLKFTSLFFDGFMSAKIREKLQSVIFQRIICADWEASRSLKVGRAIGSNAQEAMSTTKIFYSGISALYFFLGAFATIAMALSVNFKVTIGMFLVGLPLFIFMKFILKTQTKISKETAEIRNNFLADITDRFNGLFQIHAEDAHGFHLERGLKSQSLLTKSEIKIGTTQALISSFNLLMPLFGLVVFYAWSLFQKGQGAFDLAVIASIGVLGMRINTQLNGAMGNLGNLSRLSGSMHPVFESLSYPQKTLKKELTEKLSSIHLKNVNYFIKKKAILKDTSLIIKRGTPLLLNGRSGKGKTTLVNLIAGLYRVNSGSIKYVSENLSEYSSSEFLPKIGYVTQDIYLFNEDIRSNLIAGKNISDDEIWSVLDEVDASDFVREMGGLDAKILEAGKSLSGGQKRRLGIARVLLAKSQVLIFDEIIAGLDKINKQAGSKIIEKFSKKYIVVVISHEDLSLDKQQVFNI